MNCTPGPDNSNLINTENAVPTKPENKAKIRYNVPISLAFEDKNHLSFHIDMVDFIFNMGIVFLFILKIIYFFYFNANIV